MTERPAVEVEGLGVAYGKRGVLGDVSFALSRGEVLAIAGASGSGKSTLLRAILGLIAPQRGTVRILGRVVTADGLSVPPEERNLSMVFQDLALWPHLTIAGNLEFVLSARGVRGEAAREGIDQWLTRLGLIDRRNAYPGELSGGEQQRVALARALVYDPAALLLDEPFANLDVALKEQLMGLVRELLARQRVPTLLVTHDPAEAGALADRLAILEEGVLTEQLECEPKGPFARVFLRRLSQGPR